MPPQPILPTRLFASPVFTVCCVLSFVVGFAMLGAMTFLPTYMQYVDGVSATTSGLRTLPMVVGMLITSTGSGVLVGRTGRYKIFPVAGTALMAVAFVLMSRMDPSTSALVQSVYLVILGAGIGLSMQVLVLIVQNTSNFEDLGVATSGVTFFRTIGSSFGAAIFGSLFSNFLKGRIGPALATSGAPPSAVALAGGPAPPAAQRGGADRRGLRRVPQPGVPVRGAGRAARLRAGAVPARGAAARYPNSAVDLGDGFGMPTTDSPERLLENAIARMLRGAPGMRLRSIAMRPDCRLDVARAVGRHADLPFRADVRDGAAQRYRRLAAHTLRGARTHLRPAGRHRLCATRRRADVADTSRRSTGRLRVLAAVGLDQSTSWPARPASKGGRTAAMSKPPWNGSRIAFWRNAIGTRNRRTPALTAGRGRTA